MEEEIRQLRAENDEIRVSLDETEANSVGLSERIDSLDKQQMYYHNVQYDNTVVSLCLCSLARSLAIYIRPYFAIHHMNRRAKSVTTTGMV